MAEPTRRHFLALDALRGLCASLVAIAHFPALSLSNYVPMLARGDIYVDFFFVLSGFVIVYSYGDRLANGMEMARFLWSRFWRLWPLHAFILAIFLSFELLQLAVPLGADIAPFTSPGEDMATISATIALLHSMGPWPDASFNWPSWSISVEAWTYVLFAALVLLRPRNWHIALGALAILSAFSLYYLHGELFAMTDFGFLRCVYGFSCGVMAHHLFVRLGPKLQSSFTGIEVAAVLVVVAYCNFFAFGFPSMLAPLIFAAFVVIFACERGAVSKFLSHPVAVELGRRSYSVYMVHIFVAGKLFFIPAALAARFGMVMTSQSNGKPVIGVNLFSGTLAEIAFLAIVIVLAGFTYRLVELPGQAGGKKLWDRLQQGRQAPASVLRKP